MVFNQGEPGRWTGSLSAFVVKKDVADPDLKQKVTQSKTRYNAVLFFLADSESKRAEVSQKRCSSKTVLAVQTIHMLSGSSQPNFHDF